MSKFLFRLTSTVCSAHWRYRRSSKSLRRYCLRDEWLCALENSGKALFPLPKPTPYSETDKGSAKDHLNSGKTSIHPPWQAYVSQGRSVLRKHIVDKHLQFNQQVNRLSKWSHVALISTNNTNMHRLMKFLRRVDKQFIKFCPTSTCV